MTLIELVPALTPAAAWRLPWRYAIDLLDVAGVRARRRADGAAGADGRKPVARRPIGDTGRFHTPEMSELLSKLEAVGRPWRG